MVAMLVEGGKGDILVLVRLFPLYFVFSNMLLECSFTIHVTGIFL